MIPDDFAEFCASGVATEVGTRDGRLVPSSQHAAGLRVHGPDEVTVLVPEATGAVTVANARETRRIAVSVGRPRDHRTLQVKGEVISIEPATQSDREWLERHRGALAESYALVGIPPSVTFRMTWWPCHAIRFRVQGVFEQTPGPGAGAPIGAGSAGAR